MKINEKRRQVLHGALLASASYAIPTWAAEALSDGSSDLPDEKRLWDIVVVGSGLAGVAAALSALEAGAQNVLMIEKGPLIGGHSAYSTGTLAVVGSDRQKTQGVTDSLDLMWEEAKKVGGESADEALIRKIGRDSERALQWFESYGVVFTPGVFQSLGGLDASFCAR